LHGFNETLSKDKNKLCPSLPIYIGLYEWNSSNYEKKEAQAMESYHFEEERFKIH
jgi:hypothetical protein